MRYMYSDISNPIQTVMGHVMCAVLYKISFQSSCNCQRVQNTNQLFSNVPILMRSPYQPNRCIQNEIGSYTFSNWNSPYHTKPRTTRLEISLSHTTLNFCRVFKFKYGMVVISIRRFRNLTCSTLYKFSSGRSLCWYVCVLYKCSSHTCLYWLVGTVPKVIRQVLIVKNGTPYKILFEPCPLDTYSIVHVLI